MGMVQVCGENRSHRVRIYSVSTCLPCLRTKEFLDGESVEYEYLDLDMATSDEQSEAMIEIGDHMPARGAKFIFPIVIIDGYILVIGYDRARLSKIFELK